MSQKSFIIHVDSLDVLDDLTDEEAGKLFKKIKDYQKGIESKSNALITIAFNPFKNQFKRDKVKYLKKVEVNAVNGRKGGRPKNTQNNPINPVGFLKTQPNPTNPKKGYSDSDSKSKSVSDNVSKNGNVNDNKKDIIINNLPKIKILDNIFYVAIEYKDFIRPLTNVLQFFDDLTLPENKTQTENWLKCYKQLIKIDKLKEEEIYSIIEGMRGIEFWKDKFTTILKLRRKNKEDVMYWRVFVMTLKTKNKQKTNSSWTGGGSRSAVNTRDYYNF